MIVAGGCLVFLLLRESALSAEEVQTECELRAAYLGKLANFVDWPTNGIPTAQDSLVLGILGNDHFGDAMERAVRRQTFQGRRLIIRRGKEVADFKTCQILFISGGEKERLPQILEGLKHFPVLTVSEREYFCQLGGMINLKKVGQELQFEVNRQAAERAKLRISSQLLKLTVASKDPGKEGQN
jgi:hypothetical protein